MIFPDGYGTLYYSTVNKAVKVTAIAMSTDEANRYCMTHPEEGVIAEIGGLVFLARNDDNGRQFK